MNAVNDLNDSTPRMLVVGCGAVGGVLTCMLLEAGYAVTCVARGEATTAAWQQQAGFVLRRGAQSRTINGRLTLLKQMPSSGTFDYIFLAVQPNTVAEAVQAALPLLAPQGLFASLLNGLAEERIAAWVGAERVAGVVVAWGASSPAPGTFEKTSSGGFMVGYLLAPPDARLERFASVLRQTDRVDITTNLRGARWSKLAINCAVSSIGTVGGERLGKLLRYPFVRRLALEVMSEVVHVARAEGVQLQKVAGTFNLECLALPVASLQRANVGWGSLLLKHVVLLLVGWRFRRMRSSMLAQIERGREPPVDFLNGEIVERGQRHGLPVPANAALQAAVHAVARGERTSSLTTLRAVFDTVEAAIRH